MSSVRLVWYGAPFTHLAAARVVDETTLEVAAATRSRMIEFGEVDTGELIGSVDAEMHGPTEGRVNVGAPYALFVHEGHHLIAWGENAHEWIPGRPFLKGPLDEAEPGYLSALRRAFNA